LVGSASIAALSVAAGRRSKPGRVNHWAIVAGPPRSRLEFGRVGGENRRGRAKTRHKDETDMRKAALIIGVSALFLCSAGEPPPERIGVLPIELTQKWVDRFSGGSDRKTDYFYTLQTVRFRGHKVLVLDADLGDGVAYKNIGVYAPKEDGSYRLALFADSWDACKLEVKVNEKSGILEIREGADKSSKHEGVSNGEIVLSCNLKTIGTQFLLKTK
jgi:hypothetical protein